MFAKKKQQLNCSPQRHLCTGNPWFQNIIDTSLLLRDSLQTGLKLERFAVAFHLLI